MDDELKDILENGKDWERAKTTTSGVYIRRMPESKTRSASLAVEINPADKSGNPRKRKGLFIRSKAELQEFRGILSSSKLDELLVAIEKLCPEVKEKQRVIDI